MQNGFSMIIFVNNNEKNDKRRRATLFQMDTKSLWDLKPGAFKLYMFLKQKAVETGKDIISMPLAQLGRESGLQSKSYRKTQNLQHGNDGQVRYALDELIEQGIVEKISSGRGRKSTVIRLLRMSTSIPERRKVLVVDDDPEIVNLIMKVLPWTDEYELASASDGFEAGVQVIKFCPDIVILDLMMPNIDGFEVCKKIKMNPTTNHIVILVITGFGTEENIQKALECGADFCIKKPFDINELEQKIGELLKENIRHTYL